MPVHPADTPERHVRRALQLLEELEDDLRVPASSILARHDQVGLVVASRRRLQLAAAALGSPSDRPRSSWARNSASAGKILFGTAVLVASGAAFLVRSTWRAVRSALRLVLTLRAIWP